MGQGRIDIDAHNCMMQRVHQSVIRQHGNQEAQHNAGGALHSGHQALPQGTSQVYLPHRCRRLLLTSTFDEGIHAQGFHLIIRFRDNAHLCYIYQGGRTG